MKNGGKEDKDYCYVNIGWFVPSTGREIYAEQASRYTLFPLIPEHESPRWRDARNSILICTHGQPEVDRFPSQNFLVPHAIAAMPELSHLKFLQKCTWLKRHAIPVIRRPLTLQLVRISSLGFHEAAREFSDVAKAIEKTSQRVTVNCCNLHCNIKTEINFRLLWNIRTHILVSIQKSFAGSSIGLFGTSNCQRITIMANG